MSNLGRFDKYRGRSIQVAGSDNQFYVPTTEEEEEILEEAAEAMAFESMVEEGWTVVAVDACFEEGEVVQTDGLLALNGETNQLLTCDEGTNRILDGAADAAVIEVVGGRPD